MDKKNKFSLFLIIITGALFFLIGKAFEKTDYSHLSISCDNQIKTIMLHSAGLKKPVSENQKPVSGFRLKAIEIETEYLLPESVSLEKIKTIIVDASFEPLQIHRIQDQKTKEEEIVRFDFNFKKLCFYHLILKQKIIPQEPKIALPTLTTKTTLPQQPGSKQIAIVLDDWGYHNNLVEELLALKTPITFAILPHLTYSEKIAEKLNSAGYEFILHLPLEPFNAEKQPLEQKTIFTSMPKAEVIDILNYHFQSLPNLKGMNNHMGSKATADANLMSIILEQAKSHNLYFLDSLTNKDSIAQDIAREKDVVFFKRDVFLDNILIKKHILKKIEETKKIAQETGHAIAIGHAKQLTVEVLQEVIPKLKAQGFNFVFLSNLNNPGKDADKINSTAAITSNL